MPKDTLQPCLMRCEPERGGVLEAKHGPDARRWRGKGQPVDHSRDGDQHGRNATLHNRANLAISWRWRAVEAARQATTSIPDARRTHRSALPSWRSRARQAGARRPRKPRDRLRSGQRKTIAKNGPTGALTAAAPVWPPISSGNPEFIWQGSSSDQD